MKEILKIIVFILFSTLVSFSFVGGLVSYYNIFFQKTLILCAMQNQHTTYPNDNKPIYYLTVPQSDKDCPGVTTFIIPLNIKL